MFLPDAEGNVMERSVVGTGLGVASLEFTEGLETLAGLMDLVEEKPVSPEPIVQIRESPAKSVSAPELTRKLHRFGVCFS